MTDDANGLLVVELVFARDSMPLDPVLKMFVNNVNLLVSTFCWFGPYRPSIQVKVSEADLTIGGKRGKFDASITLKDRKIGQVPPSLIDTARILLLIHFLHFGLGVFLVDDDTPRHIIAEIG